MSGKLRLLERARFAWQRRVGTIEWLLLVRRECAGELPTGGEAVEPRLEIRPATLADVELWREAWSQKVDWYRERLQGGRERCILGLIDGQLVTHCWFCVGPYRDPGLAYTFDPGDQGAYQGEGWVHPDWREHGVATAFIRRLYAQVLPAMGVRHVLAYYASDNVASARLHARFRFHEIGRLLHVRLFGRHFYVRRPARPA